MRESLPKSEHWKRTSVPGESAGTSCVRMKKGIGLSFTDLNHPKATSHHESVFPRTSTATSYNVLPRPLSVSRWEVRAFTPRRPGMNSRHHTPSVTTVPTGTRSVAFRTNSPLRCHCTPLPAGHRMGGIAGNMHGAAIFHLYQQAAGVRWGVYHINDLSAQVDY